MLKSLLVSALIVSTSFSAMALELKGHLTQGGLVTGQLDNAKSVSLNGKSLKLADNGLFVFGFGRDAKPVHTLSWVDKTGKGHSQDLVITLRDYDIDKITGVAKKIRIAAKSGK
jgi:hypothetical protein